MAVNSKPKPKKRLRKPIGINGKTIDTCLKEFDFSPQVINELYDSLQECKRIIEEYHGIAARFPTAMRDEIGNLSTKADLLLLEFNELYIMSSEFMAKVRKSGGNRVEVSQKEMNEFHKKLKRIKKTLHVLIDSTEEYIKKVRHHQKYPPLPIS